VPGPRDRPRALDQGERQPHTDDHDRPAQGRDRAPDSAVRADRIDGQSSGDGLKHPARRLSASDLDRISRDRVSYDADAEFKRPVPKPEGYLPDDTGGRTAPGVAPRERDNRYTGTGWPDGPAELVSPLRQDGPGITLRDDLESTRWAGLDWALDSYEAADGDRPDAIREVVDRPHFYDPTDDRSPDRYGDPLTRPDGSRIPCLDGPPRREQTRQGWAGDCGIIAALGAVAARKPDEIANRVRQEDGSYQITLSEARGSGGVTEPTGRDIELTVTPELPVSRDDPSAPACAKTQDGTAWCAIYEKAFAGIDQTWTAQRQVAWMDDWARLCAQDRARDAEKPRSGPAPTGYVRLHQGTTPWERAEVLTQLTGQPAVVREFPSGRDEWSLNRIIRTQLTEGKPVLVASRNLRPEEDVLPHGLEDEHVYEVTGIEKGKIILRNPWNRDHPEPMETDEFARNMSRYYSTLM